MAVLKWMLKLALLPLLLLLILAQWVGIFLTTFSTILTNLLAGLFFFVALASWIFSCFVMVYHSSSMFWCRTWASSKKAK